jgi:hypothetical protein
LENTIVTTSSYARIAVGGTRDYALEQAEQAPHLRFAIKCGNEMHFGCAGIGEAEGDVIGQEHVAQQVGAIHEFSPVDSRMQ